jgi:hypothetical protein
VTTSEQPQRRRRTRPARTAAAEERPPVAEPQRRSASKAERDAERGLRGLVGAGPSQVSLGAAMRARDASQPTAGDLAAAERDTDLVRRHYVPSDAPPFEVR